MTFSGEGMIPVQRPCIGEAELEAVRRVFDSRWLGMGSTVKEFEDGVSAFLGGPQVIAVNTGTSALHLALETLGLGPGDEVLVPSFTFVASTQAISATGATPVFCDVQRDTLNLDPEDLKRKITPQSKAVMPVHYRGVPCDMEAIQGIAEEHDLRIVEDAAHAFGSTYRGQRIGSFGDVACFSFDPIKNITCGEGGAVVTNDADLAERLRQKRILGIDNDTWSRYRNERNWFYNVTTQGYRYHMSNINAAIGVEQLKRFEEFNQRKIEVAKRYDAAFASLNRVRLLRTDYEGLALFMYIVRVMEDRDGAMAELKERGIGTGVHYIPSHMFSYYEDESLSLPVTDEIFSQILTLPLFPEITDDEAAQVIAAVQAWDSGE